MVKEKRLSVLLPTNLYDRMMEFPEVNYSEVCRMAIELYVDQRERNE
jgi:metal-responsive CopG/Arc/MetJ family transcriptional regulator